MHLSLARAVVLTVALGTLAFPFAHGGENTWTVSGPPGGFQFRDLEASSTNDSTFYAAYARSFFRTTDGAATWRAYDFVQEVVDTRRADRYQYDANCGHLRVGDEHSAV